MKILRLLLAGAGTVVACHGTDSDMPIVDNGYTIAVSPPFVALAVGDTTRFYVAGSQVPGRVTWRSSDTTVATVAATGTVRAIAKGTANVIVTSNAVSAASAAAVVEVR